MNTKATPGPWGIKTTESGTKAIFSGSTGAWVAHTVRSLSSTQDANARLIAAAPELLESIQLLLDVERGGDSGGSFRERLYAGLRKCEKAVAKATGEQ